MLRKTLMLCFVGSLVCSLPVRAQEPAPEGSAEEQKNGDSPAQNRFWQTTLTDGSFMVPLDRIVSVSRAKYVLDGTLIVDEVTVDTVGQALARFYFISPISDSLPGNTAADVTARSKELVDKSAERAGVGVQDMVVKKYPDTTHAKSIEFRILSEKDLTGLYNSVRNAWESGRGRHFKAK
ncbi:hypothetical protein JIN84_10095 [Luteolibacter yonseiensis]|uniref:Uncharacterized protein n=1 Tax=Luteolibacter yonseiensis TaxID=1144680 RepID=A0A934R5S8_9BACT|nr:hypothetical protein [Luteolibacter yonseiensis]MBK1815970.1 hypothetical protein [Luteolibacter yonseiensis]